jgi:hypothetical protein
MSAKNGDKSRFQVNRKRAVLRRTKTRELLKAAKEASASKAPPTTPNRVSPEPEPKPAPAE